MAPYSNILTEFYADSELEIPEERASNLDMYYKSTHQHH